MSLKAIGAALAVLALFSFAFIGMYGIQKQRAEKKEEFYTYNSFTFVHRGGLWLTQVQEPNGPRLFTVALHYSPRELEDVSIEGPLSKGFIDAGYAYISVDPDAILDTENVSIAQGSHTGLSAAELTLVMAKAIGRTPIAACTRNESSACASRPIAPCSFQGAPTVYLKPEGEANVTFAGDCIMLTGAGTELLRSVDRLLLHWLGVMRAQPSGPVQLVPR